MPIDTPPNSYIIVNFDISSINNDDLFASLLKLQNQTLISNVNPYIEFDKAEAEVPRQVSFTNCWLQTYFPHSFMFHPVHRKPENSSNDDDIVAVVLAANAWDAALRNLLPETVHGLIAVGRNNCSQSFSYNIVGKDDFFMVIAENMTQRTTRWNPLLIWIFRTIHSSTPRKGRAHTRW